MARPRKVIDAAQVERLARIHCTYEEIAAVVGCSTDTLKRRFADRIEKGREMGKSSLRRWQFKSAFKGNATMQIWLGKQLLGQREPATDAPGGPSSDAQELARRVRAALRGMDEADGVAA